MLTLAYLPAPTHSPFCTTIVTHRCSYRIHLLLYLAPWPPQEEWHLLLGQLLASQLRPLGSHGAASTARRAAAAGGGGGGGSLLLQPLEWLVKIDELGELVGSKVGGGPGR